MIVAEGIEQNSPEWEKVKVGIPSASGFNKIIKINGGLSDQRKKYLYQLVGEKITGYKEETYSGSYMQAGLELEDEARTLFEMMTDKEVNQVGFCYHDEAKKFGCSPDGLIGKDEGLEIKCVKLSTQVEYLLSGKLPTKYFQQVQGSLFVTGRQQWHFFTYCAGIKPFHIIVERDEIFIAKLSKALDDFVVELDETYEILKGDNK